MKKKVTLIVVAILLVISLVVGLSYAYWKHTFVATNVNKIVSSCFNMEITNEKNSITLDDAYPIIDEKGRALTPYSFTITNTCDLFASYTINLEMLEGTTLNSKYVKTMINNEAITNLSTLETTDPSIEGAVESRILFKGSLGSGDSTDYTFRVWMDYDTPNNEDSMNKLFQAKITVTAEVSTYSPVENGFTNLAEALLVNEYQTTSLDVAKDKIASKQGVDTTKTAPIIIWQESHSTQGGLYTVRKADESVVGSYGVGPNYPKIMFAKSYSFDEVTGYYTLEDKAYYDPRLVDFGAYDYYLCSSASTVSGNTIVNGDDNSCSTMLKVVGLNSTTTGNYTLSNGTLVPINIFELNIREYKETELESDKSDKGLYANTDDDGITYYYRGNVNNNFVLFAGYYWRVVRINGDGSVRLLYTGNKASATGSEMNVGNTNYNNPPGDPSYVGYMYSNILKSSYEETIRNDKDATIKVKLDSWYKNNIYDKGYSSYIADSGFCNDRSLYSGNGYNAATTYAPDYRGKNSIASFNCPNSSNDLFTLTGNTKGNGALTYPVGLITIDELMFAGSTIGFLNRMTYTYSSASYWTMSPGFYLDSLKVAYVWESHSDGSISSNSGYVHANFGIRPVINLKSTVEISGGIGTKNDPFIVK